MPDSKEANQPAAPRPVSAAAARIVPFAAFMGCIAIEELLGYLNGRGTISISAQLLQWLYLPKLLVTALLLAWFWPTYQEIRAAELGNLRHTAISVVTGGLIFVLWINMDWTFDFQAQPRGFNPEFFADDLSRKLMLLSRVAGAVVVVPIMEELFWRSWLVRYLIDADFAAVAVGRFTFTAFLASSLLFGLEHHFILAGIMAGALFNGVCYVTRSLTQCILAHAVANLCLAAYILATGNWQFW